MKTIKSLDPFWLISISLIFIALEIAITLPVYADGRANTLDTMLNVQSSYNDNINFDYDTTKIVKDYIFEVDPLLLYTNGSETNVITVRTLWTVKKYHDNKDFDVIDQDYLFTVLQRFTPRIKANLITGLKMDNFLTSEGTGISKSDRHVLNGESQVNILLDEISDINFSGKLSNFYYSTPKYLDYSISQFVSIYNRKMKNEKTTFTIEPSYTFYDFSISDSFYTSNFGTLTDKQTGLYQLMAGGSHNLSETLSVIAIGGVSYTDSNVDTNKKGWLGTAELKKKGRMIPSIN